MEANDGGRDDPKSETEHPVFEALKNSKDDVESVRNFFEIQGISIEIQDSSGMTVLMHACWKGHEKIVRFLIKQVMLNPKTALMYYGGLGVGLEVLKCHLIRVFI